MHLKTITAKFKSKCAETGQAINKGEQCLYDPYQKKVYSFNSGKAMQHDQAAGMVQANEDAYFDNFCMYNNI